MSEAPRIQVERSRPTCPFCKGDVGGGHVWVCPACEAAHHADCHAEHRACATCGPSASEAAGPPPTSDQRLADLRTAAERLGFVVVREAADQVLALHPAYHLVHPLRSEALAHLVQIVVVDQLTRGQVEADVRRLASEPLARCDTTLLYATGDLEPEVKSWLRTGAAAEAKQRRPCVPLAWTSKGLVAPTGLFGSKYPRHEGVAGKLTAPPPPPRSAPPRPPVASRAASPPRPAPPPQLDLDEAKGILIAVAAAVGLGVLILAIAMAAVA